MKRHSVYTIVIMCLSLMYCKSISTISFASGAQKQGISRPKGTQTNQDALSESFGNGMTQGLKHGNIDVDYIRLKRAPIKTIGGLIVGSFVSVFILDSAGVISIGTFISNTIHNRQKRKDDQFNNKNAFVIHASAALSNISKKKVDVCLDAISTTEATYFDFCILANKTLSYNEDMLINRTKCVLGDDMYKTLKNIEQDLQ